MTDQVCIIPLGVLGLHETRVSQKHYAALTRWRWNYKKSKGGKIYARRGGGRHSWGELKPTILMHVYILEELKGERRPSDEHTPDHIDRDSLNNTEENLRWATPSEQAQNQGHRPRHRQAAPELENEVPF
jgi:hypothetical protein